MKFPFRRLNFGIFKVLGSEPEKYWNKFLFIFILLLLLILVFDGWIFLRFSINTTKIPEFRISGIEEIKKEDLSELLERIRQKEADFEKYRKGVSIEDPS
jgi:regulatory protein YycI of two-component signal transduction system YycFG